MQAGGGRQIPWQISWGGQGLVVCPGPTLAQHKGTLLRHFHNTGGLEVNTVVWHPDLNSEKGFVLESLVLAHVRSSLSASASFWCNPGRLNLPSDADWNETPITGLTRNKMNFLKGSFSSRQADQQDTLWNNSTHKTQGQNDPRIRINQVGRVFGCLLPLTATHCSEWSSITVSHNQKGSEIARAIRFCYASDYRKDISLSNHPFLSCSHRSEHYTL